MLYVAEFYAGLATKTISLLTKFGQNVTVTRAIVGTIDPVDGAGTAGTSTTFTAYAAVFNYRKNLVDGAQILSTDKKCLMQSGTEPMINDVVTTADGDFQVINVDPLTPAGTVVKYDVQLRS